MKNIKYQLFPDIAGSFVEKEGSVIELIMDMGLLEFEDRRVPSFTALNNILGKGDFIRAGEWNPFTLTHKEYHEVLTKLLSLPLPKPYTKPAPLAWVENKYDKFLWDLDLHYLYGISLSEIRESWEILYYSASALQNTDIENKQYVQRLAEVNEFRQIFEQALSKYIDTDCIDKVKNRIQILLEL